MPVIVAAHDDGHNGQSQSSEELLSDVIGAQGVLKRQIKLVFISQIVEAVLAFAWQITTLAIHVDIDVFLHECYVIFSPRMGVTVGYNPKHELTLGRPKLITI